jgi:hypothetical protein
MGMAKNMLVMVIGDADEFLTEANAHSVPVSVKEFNKSTKKQRAKFEDFVDELEDWICSNKEKSGFPCLIGITTYREFSLLLSKLKRRTEYHIVYFAAKQVEVKKVVCLLKDNYKIGTFYEVNGVIFKKAEPQVKPESSRFLMAS